MVPEFAREYLARTNGLYAQNDIVEIAKGQMAIEDRAAKDFSLIFCDTELLVTRIWSEVKFGNCDPWIIEEMSRRKYDLVLLCNTDLPWVPDPLREHPDKRTFLMNLYRHHTALLYPHFVEIKGVGNQRMQQAIVVVTHFMKRFNKTDLL